DVESGADQTYHVLVIEHRRVAARVGDTDLGGAATVGEHRHDRLVADGAREDRLGAPIHHHRVGGDVAADYRLPQPPPGGDCGPLAGAADRIGGKQHPAGLGVDQALHDHRQADRRVVDVVASAVLDRPGCPQRCPATAHRVLYCSRAAHVEKGV